MSGTNPSWCYGMGRDLEEILARYKREGKPTPELVNHHQERCCDGGPFYDYLDEPGAKLRG